MNKPARVPVDNAAAVAGAIADRLHDVPGALLPILHEVQAQFGYIPATAVPPIAERLHLSRAEVQGVMTFYHHFRTTPPGRHVLEVCRAESCQAMGSDQLSDHIRQRLGCDFHEISADDAVTLEPVYCLGLCAQSPNIAIDGKPYARMTAARVDKLLQPLIDEPAPAASEAL